MSTVENMPTIIKEFNWKQTNTHITIEIALKGVTESKMNIFISSRYVKVSHDNIFFETILLHLIDEVNSKCIISSDNVILELKKLKSIFWETLEPILSKQERNNLKQQLLEESYKKIQQHNEDQLCQKAELKRTAVRKQMETDTCVRDRIEDIKEQAKKVALGNTKEWILEAKKKSVQIHCNVAKNTYDNHKVNKCNSDTVKHEKEAFSLLPRQMKTLQVDFTLREFTTPSRESNFEEEKEWLTKQAAARRSCGFISEDIRPEERSPQFLEAKGDEFLRNQNYLAAISAYSYGLQLSNKYVNFYISRSEAHFALGKNNHI